ncbi:hypothetical protein DM860_009414 [Cuscuta australis]|uniref:Uncharacterized protein n=1 Tax=Cuscuta australis TaxID=267555 RepID=A0A328DAS2_9ASTE|nr:hypothetical protein DM860_009414 [Cuscuta australis]
MVCFCFLVDQTRKVRRSKPAAGTCSRCGGGASVADMKTATRFCYVPFYSKNWKAIVCTFCGAVLRTPFQRSRYEVLLLSAFVEITLSIS